MAVLIARRGMQLTDNIEDYPDGIIVPIDKPYRWTSADVIRKVKFCACRHFHNKHLKVGHAGTLDPLATGVLLVCIGKATKLAEGLQKHDKEYIAGIAFGATTPSYDMEKEIDRQYPVDGISESSVREALDGFIGEQEQVAPLFSAKSVDGVRAYELARRAYRQALATGSDFSAIDADASLLTKQRINISEAELLSFETSLKTVPDNPDRPNPKIHVADISGYDLPMATVRIECSKGTYIRAFARDLGEALGSGGFLVNLQRSRSGEFSVKESLTIKEAVSLLSD